MIFVEGLNILKGLAFLQTLDLLGGGERFEPLTFGL